MPLERMESRNSQNQCHKEVRKSKINVYFPQISSERDLKNLERFKKVPPACSWLTAVTGSPQNLPFPCFRTIRWQKSPNTTQQEVAAKLKARAPTIPGKEKEKKNLSLHHTEIRSEELSMWRLNINSRSRASVTSTWCEPLKC